MSATFVAAQLLPTRLLRIALLVDAAASGGMGLLLIAGSAPLAESLGLPQPLLLIAGAVCLGWGAAMFWLSRRETLTRGVVWGVIVFNALWAIESVVLLAAGWVSPTALGAGFVIAQAVLVAAFAQAQYIGLRRSTFAGSAMA